MPVQSDDEQRRQVKHACDAAGLKCVRVINEPTAACIAYGLDRGSSEAAWRDFLVFDMGARSLDLTHVTEDEGIFEIMESKRHTDMCGNKIDELIAAHCAPEALQRDDVTAVLACPLLAICEQAKCALVRGEPHTLLMRPRGGHDRAPHDADAVGSRAGIPLTREVFEAMIAPILDACVEAVSKMHFVQWRENSLWSTERLDGVVLIGGCVRIPALRARLHELFDCKVYDTIEPDQAVAMGAAVQAAIIIAPWSCKLQTRSKYR